MITMQMIHMMVKMIHDSVHIGHVSAAAAANRLKLASRGKCSVLAPIAFSSPDTMSADMSMSSPSTTKNEGSIGSNPAPISAVVQSSPLVRSLATTTRVQVMSGGSARVARRSVL
eukprot:COSAG05_NODE_817_length_7141_cov_4.933684_2_plen_115_part_00